MVIFSDGWWVWTSSSGVQDQYLELLESGMFSDAQVRCGERIWRVHKAVLCIRSVWFRKAFTGPFKETETGVVNITEFEENEVDCLLHYIYTGKVDVPKHFPGRARMTASVPMWKMGDFFCLDDLCKLALHQRDEYFRTMSSHHTTVEKPEALPQEKANSLAYLIRGVYQEKRSDVGKVFRPPLLAFLLPLIHTLSRMETFKDLLRELPELALDWAVALTGSIGSGNMPKRPSDTCSKCKKPSSKSVNFAKWIKEHEVEIFCVECFPLQRLEDWTGEGSGSN